MGKLETEHNVNDHWCTPSEAWEPMVEYFGVPGLDPFWNPNSKVPASNQWTEWDPEATSRRPMYLTGLRPERLWCVNSFERSWDGYGLVYVNGPFSKAAHYLEKCGNEGDEVIFLFKCNMNAKYIHKFVRPCDAVAFWDHRMTFEGAKHQASFHVGLGYWGLRPELFEQAYADRAWIVKRSQP